MAKNFAQTPEAFWISSHSKSGHLLMCLSGWYSLEAFIQAEGWTCKQKWSPLYQAIVGCNRSVLICLHPQQSPWVWEITPTPTTEECPPRNLRPGQVPDTPYNPRSLPGSVLGLTFAGPRTARASALGKASHCRGRGKRKKATLRPGQSLPSAKATNGMIGFHMSRFKCIQLSK